MLLVAYGHQILADKQFIETHNDTRSPTVLVPTLAGFNIASSKATAAYAYIIRTAGLRQSGNEGGEREVCMLVWHRETRLNHSSLVPRGLRGLSGR